MESRLSLGPIIPTLRRGEDDTSRDRDCVDQIGECRNVHTNNLSDVDFGSEKFFRAFLSVL
jgi:hypothetical protein